MRNRKCIGFREYESKCDNDIDKKKSKYWCKRCEVLRRKHITEQLTTLNKGQGTL